MIPLLVTNAIAKNQKEAYIMRGMPEKATIRSD
jgi:hypothetical protein